ncbi:MAG: PDZ domain-containing protein [Gemmatimonadetes bacterium]|nr:PDZ domain-containing protein [Gemmatimonadota bacterium]MYB97845.1 PDZ domain-containing protein [Gemmatimonadota bacterium]MYH54534.1 PDZ domain-containing protein [Gemmatimonadota bacterium]MYK67993.1 PDZ domain-containing protein [Gemmatimonadota bacterium]
MTGLPSPARRSPGPQGARGLLGILAALAVTGSVVPGASALQDTVTIIERGWIGIRFDTTVAPPPSVLRRSILLVADVYPDSPADLTGIVPGDRFVSVDGNPLTTHEIWLRSTSNLHAGQSIHLVLIRNGDQHEVTVVAGPAPAFVLPNPLDRMEVAAAQFDSIFEALVEFSLLAEPWSGHALPDITLQGGFEVDSTGLTVTFGDSRIATGSLVVRRRGDGSGLPVVPHPQDVGTEWLPSVGGGGAGLAGELDRLAQGRVSVLVPQRDGTALFGGVLVRDLTPEMGRTYFGVEKGVLVTDVFPMSPGLHAGFLPGDVIVSVEDKTFESVNDFRRLLVELSTPIELTVIRRESPVKIVYPRPRG